MSYWILKKRVEQYKTLTHKKGRIVPSELIALERQLIQINAEIEQMKIKKEPESIIAKKAVDRGVLKIRYKTAMEKFESQQ